MDITIGSLTLSLSGRSNTLSWNGQSTQIPRGRASEFLQVFMEHPNGILTYDQLIAKVYGSLTDSTVSYDNVRFYIRAIRRALLEIGAEADIESIWHEGWSLRLAGLKCETHTFNQKQAIAFRRVLDIAKRSHPSLVALLRDS